MLATEAQSQLRPDWEAIGHGVECPLCDYNLRGLAEPRCPECGYIFEWEEVLDPRRAKHEYLFEHHRERNLWSWWKTVAGGLRPERFWKELNPAQPSRPGRLVFYALIILAIASVPVVLELLIGGNNARGFSWYQ